MNTSAIYAYLNALGISTPQALFYNPDYDLLYSHELSDKNTDFDKGILTNLGAVSVDTGIFTGRSPKDKYIVKDALTQESVWWSDSGTGRNDNKALSQKVWKELKQTVTQQLSGKPLYIVDAWCGANKSSRLAVRIITEVAWQAHFVKNMFIQPLESELSQFEPDFLVLNASRAQNQNWQKQGLNSENFIAFNLTERIQLIGGTWYGGEMKKGLFSVMNYLLPQDGIASMHCSANQGVDGDIALFFGLSGTGKTTLSTDPHRLLIGDDEHGWDDDGVFNFEGGCYAKTINLSKEAEPEIYSAIRRDALLENVVVSDKGVIDFSDATKTENTRVSYPLSHIQNIVRPESKGGHAKTVIFLTADAFGILPPVSKLSHEQMKYHFLSGFTSKLAGTERGVSKPTPTFSACYGAAFLLLPPTTYAETLEKRVAESNADIWLVNTGWNGEGKRISLRDTRLIVKSILNGDLAVAEAHVLPIFGLSVPYSLPGISPEKLEPRNSWPSVQEWESKANELAQAFIHNFNQYTSSPEGLAIAKAGPVLSCVPIEA